MTVEFEKRTETLFDDIQGMSYDYEIDFPTELHDYEIYLSFKYIDALRDTGVTCGVYDKNGFCIVEDYDTGVQEVIDRILVKLDY